MRVDRGTIRPDVVGVLGPVVDQQCRGIVQDGQGAIEVLLHVVGAENRGTQQVGRLECPARRGDAHLLGVTEHTGALADRALALGGVERHDDGPVGGVDEVLQGAGRGRRGGVVDQAISGRPRKHEKRGHPRRRQIDAALALDDCRCLFDAQPGGDVKVDVREHGAEDRHRQAAIGLAHDIAAADPDPLVILIHPFMGPARELNIRVDAPGLQLAGPQHRIHRCIPRAERGAGGGGDGGRSQLRMDHAAVGGQQGRHGSCGSPL
jgi:hypothetical protein